MWALTGCGSTPPNNFQSIVVQDATFSPDNGAVSATDTAGDTTAAGDGFSATDGSDAAGAASNDAVTTAGDTSAGSDGGADGNGEADVLSGSADTGHTADAGVTKQKPCAFDASTGAKPEICPVGQVCVANVGGCQGWVSGVCKPAVVGCDAVVQPVCGCDGKTYNNSCEAQKKVVTVKQVGACTVIGPTVCGGKTGKTCKAGDICDIDGCDAADAGVCIANPSNLTCPNGGVKACGCDGNTYPNACYRQKAGVSLKHKGACPDNPTTTLCKVGPIKPALCPTGTYCQVYDNNPIPCVGTGECVKVPVVCDGTKKPVCGCNAQTYANSCLLDKAQQNVKSSGKCGATTCVEGMGQCAANAYCAVAQAACGATGVCINRPPATACTGVIDPVCGCDGKSYTNASCAAVQGVIVKLKGTCKP